MLFTYQYIVVVVAMLFMFVRLLGLVREESEVQSKAGWRPLQGGAACDVRM